MMIRKYKLTILFLFLLIGLAVFQRVTAAPQAKVYIVNSNTTADDANPGDGICATAGGNCTLHAAVEEANLDGEPSRIKFASQMDILLMGSVSPLILTENNTVIDASDRWDNSLDYPGVEIGGGGYSSGLLIITGDMCAVYGISFYGGSTGIGINDGNNNTIGGDQAGQRNVFITLGSGSDAGVRIHSGGAQNTVHYNYFGTRDGITANGVDLGVEVRGSNANIIEGNLIVAGDIGIMIWNFTSQDNIIRDNIIGANEDRTQPMPNRIGVYLAEGDQNIIGPDNFIAGNSECGIRLRGDNNQVYGNEIGYHFYNLGNAGDGIYLHYSDGNQIGVLEANGIAGNGGYGIVGFGDNNLIQDNGISHNELDGVYLQGQGNFIGAGSGDGNYIAANGGHGVHLSGAGTSGNYVLGNLIGLTNIGYPVGNLGHGIYLENGTHGNYIGGTAPGETNWIGGYYQDGGEYGLCGIYLTGSDTSDNLVAGNVLGAPPLWNWEVPLAQHGIGIYDGAHHNTLDSNIIMNASWSGIAIVNSGENLVTLNKIGTDGAEIHWGNNYYGIDIYNGTDNFLSDNEIAYNGLKGGEDGAEAGVRIRGAGALANTLTSNSIHDNDGPGILLLEGGNQELVAPTITQASCQGPVVGDGCAGCNVEIFSDGDNEGRIYEASVTVDAYGVFTWNGVPSGPHVTATETLAGNTSSFSLPFTVDACNTAPTAAFTVSPGSGPPNMVFSFDASGSSDPDDPSSALQVRWDWENDGTFDTAWSATKVATHAYPTTGIHIVRLEVLDTGGLSDAATQQVKVSSALFSQAIYLPLVWR